MLTTGIGAAHRGCAAVLVDAAARQRSARVKPGQRPAPSPFVDDVRPDEAERVPAVRRVDGTACVQIVAAQRGPLVHARPAAFEPRPAWRWSSTRRSTRAAMRSSARRAPRVGRLRASPLDALGIGPVLMGTRRRGAARA